MKDPNPPGSGKDTVEAKGVHREVESEERIRQISGFFTLEAKYKDKVARQTKVQSLHGIVFSSYGMSIREKERVSTRGGLANAVKQTTFERTRSNNELREVSRGHSTGEKKSGRAEQS